MNYAIVSHLEGENKPDGDPKVVYVKYESEGTCTAQKGGNSIVVKFEDKK